VTAHKGGDRSLHQKCLEPFERRDIEVVRRLVEEEHVGVVEQESREAETGALAARECRDLAVDKLHQPEPGEDASQRRLEVVPAGVLEVMLQIGIARERRRIGIAEAMLQLAQLVLELAQMRGRAARVLVHGAGRGLEQLLAEEADARAAGVRNVAGVGLVEAGRDAEQRRLTRAVGADESDAVALREAEGHVLQQLAIREPAADRLD